MNNTQLKDKYSGFTDDELYILKRQAIEASFNFTMTGKYEKAEIEMSNKLHNEFIQEINRREAENSVNKDN